MKSQNHEFQKNNATSMSKTLKTISKFILLTAVFGLVLTSCNKDDDDPVTFPTGSGDYFLNAKINDANYANSAYFAPTAAVTNGVLAIQSSNDGGNSIQIRVENYTGVGTYNVGGDVTAGYVNYTTLTPFKAYTSVRGTGTVEITEVTGTDIKGTFSAFSPENEEQPAAAVTITDGDFKVKLQ